MELQSNFTTPEQTKRLLELGVPANSADIVYYNTPDSLYDPYIITEQSQLQKIKEGIGIPCWSIGRLIEILKICIIDKKELEEIFEYLKDSYYLTECLIQVYKEWLSLLNFSKLEE